MNLKEAFRFQIKLQSMMEEAQDILGSDRNITKVQNTYLRKKVMAEAEDETTMEQPSTEYSEKITDVAVFLLHLLDEREKLSAAIHKTKAGLDLPAGLDGEVGLNSKRQEIASLFRRMAGLRASETLITNGGTGYRFNNEGNQVSYRCDVKRVVTINFDRNKIRKMCGDLSKKAVQMEQNSNFHYWTLERFSLRFSFYAIIDTEDYLADQLFIREQVRVWFGHEYVSPDSPYRVIFCKCRKKDAEAFERAMEALPNKMLLCGHRDYITYCENLKRKMEQARDHGGDPNNETVRTSV